MEVVDILSYQLFGFEDDLELLQGVPDDPQLFQLIDDALVWDNWWLLLNQSNLLSTDSSRSVHLYGQMLVERIYDVFRFFF